MCQLTVLISSLNINCSPEKDFWPLVVAPSSSSRYCCSMRCPPCRRFVDASDLCLPSKSVFSSQLANLEHLVQISVVSFRRSRTLALESSVRCVNSVLFLNFDGISVCWIQTAACRYNAINDLCSTPTAWERSMRLKPKIFALLRSQAVQLLLRLHTLWSARLERTFNGILWKIYTIALTIGRWAERAMNWAHLQCWHLWLKYRNILFKKTSI